MSSVFCNFGGLDIAGGSGELLAGSQFERIHEWVEEREREMEEDKEVNGTVYVWSWSLQFY